MDGIGVASGVGAGIVGVGAMEGVGGGMVGTGVGASGRGMTGGGVDATIGAVPAGTKVLIGPGALSTLLVIC